MRYGGKFLDDLRKNSGIRESHQGETLFMMKLNWGQKSFHKKSQRILERWSTLNTPVTNNIYKRLLRVDERRTFHYSHYEVSVTLAANVAKIIGEWNYTLFYEPNEKTIYTK